MNKILQMPHICTNQDLTFESVDSWWVVCLCCQAAVKNAGSNNTDTVFDC